MTAHQHQRPTVTPLSASKTNAAKHRATVAAGWPNRIDRKD